MAHLGLHRLSHCHDCLLVLAANLELIRNATRFCLSPILIDTKQCDNTKQKGLISYQEITLANLNSLSGLWHSGSSDHRCNHAPMSCFFCLDSLF